MIATKFQRLYACFQGPAIKWDQYGNRTTLVEVDVGN